MKELIASNKYGKLYRTSEGYHIDGNKSKFLENIKKDLKSEDPFALICAQNVMLIIADEKEV